MITTPASFWTTRGDANTASLLLASASSQYAENTTAANFNIPANKLSMQQWIKPSLNTAIRVFQGQFDFAANQEAYTCYYQSSAGALRFRLENPAGLQDYVQWPITPTIGAWQHYSFVWDGALTVATGSMKFFINGVDQGAPATLTVNNIVSLKASTAAYRVGAWDAGSAAGTYYDGLIDEVRLWNIALTGAEILANYNTQIDPATAGLMHYYRLNNDYADPAGGDALTPVNAPVFSADVPFP